MLNVDWHVNTFARNSDWNGFCVVLIFKEQGQTLADFSNFNRHKSELDLHIRVAFDLRCSLETHSRQELVEDYGNCSWHIFIFRQLLRKHKRHTPAVSGLYIDFGAQRPFIFNVQVLSARLAKDNVSKFDRWLLHFNQCLFASTDQWNVDLPRFSENRKEAVYVLV